MTVLRSLVILLGIVGCGAPMMTSQRAYPAFERTDTSYVRAKPLRRTPAPDVTLVEGCHSRVQGGQPVVERLFLVSKNSRELLTLADSDAIRRHAKASILAKLASYEDTDEEWDTQGIRDVLVNQERFLVSFTSRGDAVLFRDGVRDNGDGGAFAHKFRNHLYDSGEVLTLAIPTDSPTFSYTIPLPGFEGHRVVGERVPCLALGTGAWKPPARRASTRHRSNLAQRLWNAPKAHTLAAVRQSRGR